MIPSLVEDILPGCVHSHVPNIMVPVPALGGPLLLNSMRHVRLGDGGAGDELPQVKVVLYMDWAGMICVTLVPLQLWLPHGGSWDGISNGVAQWEVWSLIGICRNPRDQCMRWHYSLNRDVSQSLVHSITWVITRDVFAGDSGFPRRQGSRRCCWKTSLFNPYARD